MASRGALIEEINRVYDENKKLTELLKAMCESYDELRNQLMEHTNSTPTSSSRKRKDKSSNGIIRGIDPLSESGLSDEESSKKPKEEEPMKTKISSVAVRTETSDNGLVVNDGYHWRKYGQKVTRDNPSPRAYYKCSFAPTCPVKKKVQRSIKDRSVVVATYEGEHNHPSPSELSSNSGSRSLTIGNVPCSTSMKHTSPTITLDLTQQKLIGEEEGNRVRADVVDSAEFQSYSVEQMASTLVKDPSFQAALAAAISGNFLRHQRTQ